MHKVQHEVDDDDHGHGQKDNAEDNRQVALSRSQAGLGADSRDIEDFFTTTAPEIMTMNMSDKVVTAGGEALRRA